MRDCREYYYYSIISTLITFTHQNRQHLQSNCLGQTADTQSALLCGQHQRISSRLTERQRYLRKQNSCSVAQQFTSKQSRSSRDLQFSEVLSKFLHLNSIKAIYRDISFKTTEKLLLCLFLHYLFSFFVFLKKQMKAEEMQNLYLLG